MGQLVAQMGQLEAQFGSEAQISRLEAHIRYILILASRSPILAFTWVGVASSWPTQPQIKLNQASSWLISISKLVYQLPFGPLQCQNRLIQLQIVPTKSGLTHLTLKLAPLSLKPVSYFAPKMPPTCL